MDGLMSLAEFRSYRDSHAKDSMRARGKELQPKLTAAWRKVLRIRRWRDVLTEWPIASGYNMTRDQANYRHRVINLREKVQKKLDAAYEVWAEIDVEISAIVRDPRYVEWQTGKKRIQMVADDMMDVFGMKRASGE